MSDQRDGFEVVTRDGEFVSFISCSYDSERQRERVLMGLLRNLREDCIVKDTRDKEADDE